MKRVAFIFTCLLLAIPCQARTITVDDDAPADFNNIQSAIDDANNGDVIIVAPGEYIINEPITYRGKNITLKSEEGPEKTIVRINPIDRYHASVFIFENGEDREAVLEGFTITGGKGYLSSPFGTVKLWGGGIYCQESSPTIKNSIIKENKGEGGGIACLRADPLIISNVILNNEASEGGGGIYAHYYSRPIILNNIIKENSVWSERGGGIYCDYYSSIVVKNNIIIDNFADEIGGGISIAISQTPLESIIENNIIAKNRVYEFGGGIHFIGNVVVVGNTIVQNSAGHGGSGISGRTENLLVNNIIYDNTLLHIQPSQVFYSDISQEGFAGINGNIFADPLFADPNNNDYHLKSQAGRWYPNVLTWIQDEITSLCIDAGDPASPIGLEPFPNGGIINMGAYGGTAEASKSYFGEPVCETIVAGDINGDCKVDFQDFALMASHWLEER